MSRWAHWSRGTEDRKKGFSSFLKESPPDVGNPSAMMGPAERARQLGLQSNGRGGYIDPSTGQLVARTVNNELIFYDNNAATGGAVADSSGGSELVKAQPSWSDPLTGMLVTPPGKPETPSEIAAVPDPIPATPPAGYNSFMQQKKLVAYQQNTQQPEQPQMDQGGDPTQQPAFAAEDKKTFDMFIENDAAQKLADQYKKNQADTQKGQTAAYLARAKATQQGGVDPKSLLARSQGLTPSNGDLKLRARALSQTVPQVTQPDNAQSSAQPNAVPQLTDRQKVLQSRLDAVRQASTLAKGAGANALTLEDIGAFRNYIKNGPQNKFEEISDDDMDWAMNYLKEGAGKKWNSLQGRLKGKGDPEPSRKVVARAREVVQSYLSNFGQSAIDGSPLPFSDSELDHGISLSNGGLDEMSNWRWLPKRFNQFKGDLDDNDLLSALDKEEERQNSPDYKIKQQTDKFKNETREKWRKRFEEEGWESLNVADIRQAKGDQGLQMLKSLAEKSGVSYYKDRGKTRESGRAGGGTSLGVEELQQRLIDQLGIPDQSDIESWDRNLFEVLQRIEDQRSELDDAKRARRKEKRDSKTNS